MQSNRYEWRLPTCLPNWVALLIWLPLFSEYLFGAPAVTIWPTISDTLLMANQLLAFPTRLNPPTSDCALIFQYRSIYGHQQTLNPSPFIRLVTILLDKFRYFGQGKNERGRSFQNAAESPFQLLINVFTHEAQQKMIFLHMREKSGGIVRTNRKGRCGDVGMTGEGG